MNYLLICSVILILIIFLLVNNLYKKTNYYNNQILEISKYHKENRNNLKIVNLGSTYAQFAFGNYDELKLNGFSFALQSKSLKLDYKILLKYSKWLSEKCVVIIPLAPCLLQYENDDYKSDLLYYDVLGKDINNKYSFKQQIKHNFPIIGNPKKLFYIFKDQDRYETIYDKYRCMRSEVATHTQMKELTSTWMKIFKLNDLKTPDFSATNVNTITSNIKILNEILELCKIKQFRPVMVIPPFSTELNSYFSDQFVNKALTEHLLKISLKFNIPLIDYRSDSAFKDAICFIDGGFCLNKFGSQKFMKLLFKDLNEFGIIVNNETSGLN